MGCIPIQSKKNNTISETTQKSLIKLTDNKSTITSDYQKITDDQRRKKSLLSEIKITNSVLVRKGFGDPYIIYEVIQRLGEGTFGQVYKVIHKINREIRAMKVIIKFPNTSSQDEKALINEINILKNLDHPNIIKVYEFFNTPRKFFIITELCTGGELFDRITEVKHFDEVAASHIIRQLISTVRFCHINNVIHRDLKPENILIETLEERNKKYFTIKVIDFGTSEIFIKNKLLKKQIGTPFYIAPEVLENSYNEKCDVWSCGVILFILLCGNPPFYGDNDDEIFSRVKEGKYSFAAEEWENVSDEAKDLINRLLNKDVKLRLSAEEALSHKWFDKMKLKKKKDKLPSEFLIKAVDNLRCFRADQKLQQAALAFIVRHHTKKEDLDELRKIFMEFDENNNGHLTKNELIKGLSRILTHAEAICEVEKMMSFIDMDQNGYIEYEEFLRASLNKEKILTEENLKHAFEIFDIDKSGKINSNELKIILGGDSVVSEEAWIVIIKDIDKNNDGEICFEEFKIMMYGIINSV